MDCVTIPSLLHFRRKQHSEGALQPSTDAVARGARCAAGHGGGSGVARQKEGKHKDDDHVELALGGECQRGSNSGSDISTG